MKTTSVDSHWWMLVAGVLVWSVASTILLVTTVLFNIGGQSLVLLAYAAIGLLVLLPVGLYMDGQAMTAAQIEWEPDVALYVVGGAIGIFLPILGTLVAGIYLYQRHRFVGIP